MCAVGKETCGEGPGQVGDEGGRRRCRSILLLRTVCAGLHTPCAVLLMRSQPPNLLGRHEKPVLLNPGNLRRFGLL